MAPRPTRDDARAMTTKVGTSGYTISWAMPLNSAAHPSRMTLFGVPGSRFGSPPRPGRPIVTAAS
jgi:hypothetical protein